MNSGMNPLVILLLIPLLGTAVIMAHSIRKEGHDPLDGFDHQPGHIPVRSLWMLAQFNPANPDLQMEINQSGFNSGTSLSISRSVWMG